MAQEQSNIRERGKTRFSEPNKYTVFIHNDDFTTMEFVVLILTEIFHKSMEEAYSLMLAVHHSDKAPVGTYPYDIAITKTRRATELARNEGFPLRLSVEKL